MPKVFEARRDQQGHLFPLEAEEEANTARDTLISESYENRFLHF